MRLIMRPLWTDRRLDWPARAVFEVPDFTSSLLKPSACVAGRKSLFDACPRMRLRFVEGCCEGMTADSYATWSAVVARAKLGVAPAELQGAITAFLCAGWSGRAQELLASLALISEEDDVPASHDLQALLEHAAARIHDRMRALMPAEFLLPDGTLATRADAVVDWCRGFLGGLGLTGALAGSAQAPEIRELLSGLEQIAASHLACDEEDEAALDDLLDFSREAVAHLHALFAPAGQP